VYVKVHKRVAHANRPYRVHPTPAAAAGPADRGTRTAQVRNGSMITAAARSQAYRVAGDSWV